MSDSNSNELDFFSEEEICLIEEMGEMLEEMTEEEIDEFVVMAKSLGNLKKQNKSFVIDQSDYYH